MKAMEFDWTALHVAALAGKASCAMDLVKGKANINYWNEEGMTALHLAAAKGHTELVGQLIAAGAATDMRTRSGACAHDCAALSGHMSTAEVIPQRYAADPDFDDQNSPYYYEKPNWGTAQASQHKFPMKKSPTSITYLLRHNLSLFFRERGVSCSLGGQTL